MAGISFMSTSAMVTPASRNFWVLDAAVPGRKITRAVTDTFLLRKLRAIWDPRLPAAPATATKLFEVDIWLGVI